METLEETLTRLINSYGEAEILIKLGQLLQIEENQSVVAYEPPVFGSEFKGTVASVEHVIWIVHEHFGIERHFNPYDLVSSIPDMDSLDQIELVMAIEDEVGVEIDDSEAERMMNMTFDELAEWLKQRKQPC